MNEKEKKENEKEKGIEKGRKERTWHLTKDSYWVKARLTAQIYDAVLSVLQSGAYFKPSEYVTDLIRKDLEERGVEIEPLERVAGEEEEEEEKEKEKEEVHPPRMETDIISTRVPLPVREAMEQVVDSGIYYSPSEYFRDVVKRDLESRGIILGLEERETGFVQARVPLPVREAIDRALDSGLYRRVQDYLRDVIKRDLESRGIKLEAVKAEPEQKEEPAERGIGGPAFASTMVPMPLMEGIYQLLDSGLYLKISDYLLDLIRKDLESRGLGVKTEET